MRVEGGCFRRVDFHSAGHAFAVDIDDPAAVFELLAAVGADEFAAFFPVFSSSSAPSIASVAAGEDGQKERNSRDALAGFS